MWYPLKNASKKKGYKLLLKIPSLLPSSHNRRLLGSRNPDRPPAPLRLACSTERHHHRLSLRESHELRLPRLPLRHNNRHSCDSADRLLRPHLPCHRAAVKTDCDNESHGKYSQQCSITKRHPTVEFHVHEYRLRDCPPNQSQELDSHVPESLAKEPIAILLSRSTPATGWHHATSFGSCSKTRSQGYTESISDCPILHDLLVATLHSQLHKSLLSQHRHQLFINAGFNRPIARQLCGQSLTLCLSFTRLSGSPEESYPANDGSPCAPDNWS